MKKLFTVVFTMLLAGCLAFGQTGGDKSTLNPQPLPPGRHADTGKKATKTSKAHKGGKKSKKGSGTTTPPPK